MSDTVSNDRQVIDVFNYPQIPQNAGANNEHEPAYSAEVKTLLGAVVPQAVRDVNEIKAKLASHPHTTILFDQAAWEQRKHDWIMSKIPDDYLKFGMDFDTLFAALDTAYQQSFDERSREFKDRINTVTDPREVQLREVLREEDEAIILHGEDDGLLLRDVVLVRLLKVYQQDLSFLSTQTIAGFAPLIARCCEYLKHGTVYEVRWPQLKDSFRPTHTRGNP